MVKHEDEEEEDGGGKAVFVRIIALRQSSV